MVKYEAAIKHGIYASPGVRKRIRVVFVPSGMSEPSICSARSCRGEMCLVRKSVAPVNQLFDRNCRLSRPTGRARTYFFARIGNE